jgi:hypothetical protein
MQPRHGTHGISENDSRMIEDLPELPCGFGWLMRSKVSLPSDVYGVHRTEESVERDTRHGEIEPRRRLQQFDGGYRLGCVESQQRAKRWNITEADRRVLRKTSLEIVSNPVGPAGLAGECQCEGRRIFHVAASRERERSGGTLL